MLDATEIYIDQDTVDRLVEVLHTADRFIDGDDDRENFCIRLQHTGWLKIIHTVDNKPVRYNT